MNEREVIPLKQKPVIRLTLPGSKSITNRALLCAALADGTSRLFGALFSDDTQVMMAALRKMGAGIRKAKDGIEVRGTGGRLKKGKMVFELGNAGTAVRFLTALMAVRDGETVITGDARMCERPIGDLVKALKQIGLSVDYLGKADCPPLCIHGLSANRLSGKPDNRQQPIRIKIRGDKSSQYLSALLMLGPLMRRTLVIDLVGELASRPYIDTTLAVMRAFGVRVKNSGYRSFEIRPQAYRSADYCIEGDASAASYWTAIAHLYNGRSMFENLGKKSIQGDSAFSSVLPKLGKGTIDMSDMPDVAMTAVVTAPFAKGKTIFTGLSTLRLKETDRLAALKKELGKLGIEAAITKESIMVPGRGNVFLPQNNVRIETYNDHRMAMCFAVVGTLIPRLIIQNPDCVRKTYPNFWADFERAYFSPIRLGRKNLVLTGMRGSGKTHLGKKIARMLGRSFVDMDEEIEKNQGMKISEIVKRHGWPYFRKIESVIAKVLADQSSEPLVIATGGGVVLDSSSMKILKESGLVVFIFADPSILIERVKKESGKRPSLTGGTSDGELRRVWRERRELYLKYADVVWDNTSGRVEKFLGKIFRKNS